MHTKEEEAQMNGIPMFPKPKKLTPEEKLRERLEKQRIKARERVERVKKDLKEKRLEQLGRVKQQRNKAVQKAKEPTLRELLKSTQRKVNKYVRMRDAKEPCISCGKTTGQMDAGHFWTQGEHGAIRYNLDNLNKQCRNCNYWKSGNLNEYRMNLVKKIGKERVEWLDAHSHDIKKWTREELLQIQQEVNNDH